MKLVSLSIQNFKSLTGPHVIPLNDLGVVHVLGENKVSESADSNGSGKTALAISAPCWIFFGRTESKRQVGGESVRNRFVKGPAVGEIEYENRGDRFHLTRDRRKDGTDSVRLVGPHGKIYDAKHEIERELGFDWGFFTNVVVFGPDTNARFTQATDVERKGILDQVIPDLERLNAVFARADALAKDVARALESGEHNEKYLILKIEGFEKIQAEIDEQRSRLGDMKFERWRNCMIQQRELNEERVKLYEELSRRNILDDRFAALTPLIHRAEMAEEQREHVHGKIVVLEERADGLEANLRARVTDAKNLVKQGKCPTCMQRISRKAGKDLIARAEARDGMSWDTLASQKESLAKLREELGKVTEVCEELNHVADLNAELQKQDRSCGTTEYIRSQLTLTLRKLSILQAEELMPVPFSSSSVGTDLLWARTEKKNLDSQLERLRIDSVDAGWWQEALGPRGIKSLLLDGVEEYLDERLRHYSGRLTAGEVSIGFSSRTKLKSGEGRNKVAVTAEHLFGAGELELHSSGERQRIDLAVILALQDLAREQKRQAGGDVRLSLYDEVFDHLDESGVERLMGLLQDEKAERGTILVVTQNPRLSSQPADHQIVVRRTDAGTVVLFDGEES